MPIKRIDHKEEFALGQKITCKQLWKTKLLFFLKNLFNHNKNIYFDFFTDVLSRLEEKLKNRDFIFGDSRNGQIVSMINYPQTYMQAHMMGMDSDAKSFNSWAKAMTNQARQKTIEEFSNKFLNAIIEKSSGKNRIVFYKFTNPNMKKVKCSYIESKHVCGRILSTFPAKGGVYRLDLLFEVE